MVKQVKAYIKQWDMIKPKDMVTLGVSGGADSVCLLLLMQELSQTMHFTLQVVHVEHGIRGEESIKDAAFVEALCHRLQVPFICCPVDVPEYAKGNHLGLEEAARALRYEALIKKAKGPIALAHHREDNIETILFQMARGSGLDGLCGMRPVRVDGEGNTFIRPLLGQSREAIERFLRQRGQSYCVDSTNLDIGYSRNRIRHRVVPELVKINSQALLHMQKTAEQMGKLRDYLELKTQEEYKRLMVPCPEGEVALDADRLRELPEILKGRVLLLALYSVAGCRRDFTSAHMEAIQGLLHKQSGRRLSLPYGITVYRAFDRICVSKADTGESCREIIVSPEALKEAFRRQEEWELTLNEAGDRLIMRRINYSGDPAEISTKLYTKWLDYDKIKDGFCVRNRREGDYFLINPEGRRKKLKAYMIDQKIPVRERSRCLLICKESEVLWLIGGRMGAGAAVSPGTKLVLQITYKGGKDNGLPQETQDRGTLDGAAVESEDSGNWP